MNLDQNTLIEETQKIITAADEAHAPLRLLGSVAFRLHCPKFTAFSESMKRELIHDIDLVCRSDQCNTLTKIFSKLNYGMD